MPKNIQYSMSEKTRQADGVSFSAASRPKWHTPRLSQYGITGHTAITNCGSGTDGVICSSS